MSEKKEVIDYTSMNVYKKQALLRNHKLLRELKKGGENKNNKFSFKYYELSDFLPQIIAIENEIGLTHIFNLVENDTKGLLTVVNTDNPEETIKYQLGADAIPGTMAPIQKKGALSTYLKRFTMMNYAEISQNDSIDSQDQSNFVEKATWSQVEEIKQYYDIEVIENNILDFYKRNSLKDLTYDEATQVIAKGKRNQKRIKKQEEPKIDKPNNTVNVNDI